MRLSHGLVGTLIVLLIGAYLAGMWPSLNVVGRIAGKVGLPS